MTATNIIQFPTKQNFKPEVKSIDPTKLGLKDKCVWIRKELKKLGWNSRKVSVKLDRFSMGCSIDVYVKSPEVNENKVEEIVNKVKDVRRCEISGDILSGGNTYVSVSVEESVWEERMEPSKEELIYIATELINNKEKQHQFNGKTVWRECRHSDGRDFYIGNKLNYWSDYSTPESLALEIYKYTYEQV